METDKYIEKTRSVFLTLVVSSIGLLLGVHTELKHDAAIDDIGELQRILVDTDLFWDLTSTLSKEIVANPDLVAMLGVRGDLRTTRTAELPLPLYAVDIENTLSIPDPPFEPIEQTTKLTLGVPVLYVPPDLWLFQTQGAKTQQSRKLWNALQQEIHAVVDIAESEIVFDEDGNLVLNRWSAGEENPTPSEEKLHELFPKKHDFDTLKFRVLRLYYGSEDGYGISDETLDTPVLTRPIEPRRSWCSSIRDLEATKCGSFDHSFPALSEAMSEISASVSLEEMKTLLNREKSRAGNLVSLAGVSVPRGQVFWAGMIVLWSIGVYLTLHIRELHRQSDEQQNTLSSTSAPWIGLFRGRFPLIVSLCAVFLLPSLALTWISWIASPWSCDAPKYIASLLSIAFFGYVSLELIQLRRAWFREHATELD